MSAPLLVLTGPGTPAAAARWVSAAERVGWRCELRPIARTGRVNIVPGSIDVAPPAWIAITSANALPALKRLWEARPDLKIAPHAVLGMQLARPLEQQGVSPALIATGTGVGIDTLAEALVEASETGDRVLWPRGARATSLRERLVVAGRYVQAPIAYRTVTVPDYEAPLAADATFFASPEAARAWLERDDVPRTTAIALGPACYEELAGDYARFVRILRLQRPRPEELGVALAGLSTS